MATLAEIRLQARQRADMVQSEFVEDSELTNYVNASLAELHDLLISAYNEDYYMESVSFDSDGTLSYDLPDGANYSGAGKFYKLRGVDASADGATWSNVRRFNFNKRNADSNSFLHDLSGNPSLEYRLVGSQLRLNRIPDTGTQLRVWYHPALEPLVDDTDEFDDVNGFIDYVVVDCAIKMLQKQEDDVSVLLAQKQALAARIAAMAANRDANEPESISDIYAEDADTIAIRGY
jgi:hypothetical protein